MSAAPNFPVSAGLLHVRSLPHGQAGLHQNPPEFFRRHGFFYVTKKNARTKTDKLVLKKYDPVVRKHVEFREGKIK